jgi:hypothetical protein
MKSLIILGNGKSLKDFDLNTLSNEDTFGLNGAYLRFQELNWFPKYYGYFAENNKYWAVDEIMQFIKDNYLKCDKFFCLDTMGNIPDVSEIPRIHIIRQKLPANISFDNSKYSTPLFVEFLYLRDLLTAKFGKEAGNMMKDHFTKNKVDTNLNSTGLYKMVTGEGALNENDYTRLPRFDIKWMPPTSFDNFISSGNSGYYACLVGLLMGYEKIILLGFDFNFVANNNIVDTSQTFWFNNYFKDKEYNIKDVCKCMTPESLYDMQAQSFMNLKEMIEANNLKLDIVNCTEGSKLNVFRKSTLEKEL